MKMQIQSYLDYSTSSSQADKHARLINQIRNCLMDLSLNFNTVHFVEHSSFLDLTGLR